MKSFCPLHFGRKDTTDLPIRGSVAAPNGFQGLADLPQRGAGPGRLHRCVEQIARFGTCGGQFTQGAEGGSHCLGVPGGSEGLQSADLVPSHLVLVDFQQVQGRLFLRLEQVHTDDAVRSAVDARLLAGGRLLDSELGQSGFDGPGHPPQRLHLVDERLRFLGDLACQMLHPMGTGPRIHGMGHPGLLLEEQLGIPRNAGRSVGRQGDGLIQGVRVQGLGPPEGG